MADQGAAPDAMAHPSAPPPAQGPPPPAPGTPGGGPSVVMQAPPIQVSDGTMAVDPIPVTMSLLRACKACGDLMTTDTAIPPAEAEKLGNAALKFAQAVITLDPGRMVGGDTPDSRVAAAPITPKTPPVTDRDHDGSVGS